MSQGRSQDFSKGGDHTVSNIIVMAFSPRNIVGCFLKQSLTKGGGSRAPQDPLATPLCKLKLLPFSSQEEIKINTWEEVEIPDEYKGLIIGKRGANLRVISKETGAEVTRKGGEVYVTKGTEQQRDKAKLYIRLKTVGNLIIFFLLIPIKFGVTSLFNISSNKMI